MVIPGQVTATGLFSFLVSNLSQDQSSRMLSESYDLFSSQQYWKIVKPLVRKVESVEGILIIEDFISKKPHSS